MEKPRPVIPQTCGFGERDFTMIITTEISNSFIILSKWWRCWGCLWKSGDHGVKWEGSDSYSHLRMIQTEADRCLENPAENGQSQRAPSTFLKKSKPPHIRDSKNIWTGKVVGKFRRPALSPEMRNLLFALTQECWPLFSLWCSPSVIKSLPWFSDAKNDWVLK